MLFGNLFKKKDIAVSINSFTHGEDDNTMIHLSYVKVPLTLEMRNRQYEELLREKYKIPKAKIGVLL